MQRLVEYISRCPFSLTRMISIAMDGKILYRAGKAECIPFPKTGDKDLSPGMPNLVTPVPVESMKLDYYFRTLRRLCKRSINVMPVSAMDDRIQFNFRLGACKARLSMGVYGKGIRRQTVKMPRRLWKSSV